MGQPPIDVLLSRRSVPALQLSAPGPDPVQFERALQAALRAPDHGGMRPWRLVRIEGAARERLSALLVRRMLERQPPAPAGKVDRARAMPLAAPLVLALGAHIVTPHKVPELEQLLACGAAIMNFMNALHAQGFGAIWLTGENAYDEQIAHALGFGPAERCIGFLYVGTPPAAGPEPPPARRPEGLVRDWSGEAPVG